MKKFLLILFLHSFALIGFSQNLEIPITQKECTEQIISHLGFTVSYNEDWLIPNWVAYELTNTEVNGTYPRRGSFCPDPKVKGRTAVTYDYSNSGYDRGHMAPAADLKWSEQSMLESFYLSNICPQNRNLNSGIWLGLEEAVRDWARNNGAVYVICGPVMGEVFDTIGDNAVAIPQGFFKVICKNVKGLYCSIGFYFPNDSVTGNLFDFAKSVDEIERLTGFDFFSLIPDEIENKIESTYNSKDWRR